MHGCWEIIVKLLLYNFYRFTWAIKNLNVCQIDSGSAVIRYI